MNDVAAAAGLKPAVWEEGPTPIHYLHRIGHQPTLVCLHGLGDSSRTFPEFLANPALRNRAVLAPDAPGFGRSPRRSEASLSLWGQARAILELLDALGVEAFVIVGHSLGGAVGVHLAGLASYRCAGFVNLEGNLTLADCSLSLEATAADREGRYAAWREELPARFEREGKAGEPGKLRYLESFALSDPDSFLELSYALVADSTGSRLGHLYADLSIPRLYLHGTKTTSEENRAFLENHRLNHVEFSEAGHWVHWDAREEAAAACGEFLDTL